MQYPLHCRANQVSVKHWVRLPRAMEIRRCKALQFVIRKLEPRVLARDQQARSFAEFR